MADACWIHVVIEADNGDDLSSWEIVNSSSDDDAIEDYSYDDDDDDVYVLESPSSDLSVQSPPFDHADLKVDHHRRPCEEDLGEHISIDEQFGYHGYGDYDDDGEEDENEEQEECDDDGLDDELVPKSVSDRFGRERLRKLGKRAYSKMNKSKRLPYLSNRPGCVRGKHGLGLKW
ncbi:uncharacterized protein LOC127801258 [Diospyros lotus]|uniref:uncharacterized protein LOC127801258 n=1 Tax=Diospyros lotus TaxID=55363 RepID=UPI00225A7105|nr:uncharacterized protein LOC127801258 [Diospyros lotus]